MSEETFDIFSGAPDENGLWVEAIEGLAGAQQRMGRSQQRNPAGTSFSRALTNQFSRD